MQREATIVPVGEAVAEASQQGSPSPVQAHAGQFTHFFFWFLLFPVLAYLSAFAVVRSASYEHWSQGDWGPILDFAFAAGHQDADVVIFGDSSAFIGVDPRLVNAKLGIKSIVLPGTVGSLPVTNDMALQHYLANNPRPRLIVFYFSAWNLDYKNNPDTRLFEGEEMLFRHATGPEIATFIWHHPIETLAFPLRLYSTFGPGVLRAMMAGKDRARNTAQALGHADDPDPFPPLDDGCALPTRLLRAGNDASVRELAQKYTASGIDVMVYLAPLPACRNASAVIDRRFNGLETFGPADLPPHDFLADPHYAHVEPPFVPDASNLLATALAKRLGPADVAKRPEPKLTAEHDPTH